MRTFYFLGTKSKSVHQRLQNLFNSSSRHFENSRLITGVPSVAENCKTRDFGIQHGRREIVINIHDFEE